MFTPLTTRIKDLASNNQIRIDELVKILEKPTNVYIDFANVKPWSEKLGWHVDLKRVRQLFESFDTVGKVKVYIGTLIGDEESEKFIDELEKNRCEVITKPVKIIKKSIDVSSIPLSSTDILRDFIRKPLLRMLKVETIEYLNNRLKELNDQGIFYIKDRKCNFDVEIGRDMLLDFEKKKIDTYILWSGDSDFASTLEHLLQNKKKVYVFATARKVASELNDLRKLGLAIYDIQKIRDFICWPREMRG